MNAMAPRKPDKSLTETIDYESGPERPAGSLNMANPSPQTPFRYTYGSGSRPLDGFTIKRAIGRGGFGEVYYATSDSGKEVALKLITRNVDVERRGVAQCMNLKCQNLLTIYDIRSNDSGETFVVMEYVAGPSLAAVLEKYPNGMPVNEVRAWLKGLVEGVDYLHDHGIVHRDLKPANLFLEEGIVKIGDYGLAKIVSPQQGSEHSESIGTCHYMAPEISTGKYHKPIDVYAIGVILYEMLTGGVPFEGETVGEVLMKHLTTRPDLSRLAEPYRTIVGEALAKDPTNRPKRAHDLLGPEDGARVRDVRFIGEGKTSPKPEGAPEQKAGFWGWGKKEQVAEKPGFRPPEDDVLRIGEVDPVFYIGPETRPPRPIPNQRRRPVVVPPIRWVGEVIRRAPVRRAVMPRQVAPAARPVARPVPPQQVVQAPPPPPPVEPAAPSRRVRTAEVMGSMVKSALVIGGVLALIIARNDFRPTRDLGTGAAAFLFTSTLLGTWGVLLSSKMLEAFKAPALSRRFANLATGIGVGLGVAYLATFFHIDFVPDHGRPMVINANIATTPALPSAALPLAAFFGAAFFLNGWWKHADRDRRSYVRLVPLVATGVITLALTPLFPYRETWYEAIIPVIALATQISTPWNRAAAKYATYIRKNKPAVVAA